MPLLNLGNAASFLWSPVADPNPNPNQAELYQSLLADALQQVAYEAVRAGLGTAAG